jgi:hypothetical protein
MASMFFWAMDASNNMAHSIVKLRYTKDSDMYWVMNSNFNQNYLDSGAVFKTEETFGFQILFATPEKLSYIDLSGSP